MKLGLFGVNIGPNSAPEQMAEIAQAAEAAGYESLWTGEHIVLPEPQAPPSPSAPETDFVDSAVALSYIAGVTSTIKLGTGIIILPQRQPAVLAKSLASLDHVSSGRLLFGLGVGYLEPEMTACSTPMARRGERSDEYLAAMRALWTTDAACFDGDFVQFDSVTANPKPAQSMIHTVVGGHSGRAHRRAAELAHGWYGFRRDIENTAADMAALRQAVADADRDPALGDLEISITPAGRPTKDLLSAYAELGVGRVIMQIDFMRDTTKALDFITEFAPA